MEPLDTWTPYCLAAVDFVNHAVTALFTKPLGSWLPGHSRVCLVLFLKIPIAMNGGYSLSRGERYKGIWLRLSAWFIVPGL